MVPAEPGAMGQRRGSWGVEGGGLGPRDLLYGRSELKIIFKIMVTMS